MDALVAVFSILFAFWPLILFFGVRELFNKHVSWTRRFQFAVQSIFIAWLVWASFYFLIWTQDRTPLSLLPEPLNSLAFFGFGLIFGVISITIWIHWYRQRRVRLQDARTLEDLLAMDPVKFEGLVAEIFRAYGYEVHQEGGSADHGVDVVVITDSGEKWIVQCKRYSGSVGEPVLRDLYGTMLHEGGQRAYLITTGSFTQQAKNWISDKPIVLYDGESLVELIRRTKSRQKKHRGNF